MTESDSTRLGSVRATINLPEVLHAYIKTDCRKRGLTVSGWFRHLAQKEKRKRQ